MRNAALFCGIGLIGLVIPALAAQSADELLARLDDNQTADTTYIVGALQVQDRYGKKTTGFEVWSRGKDKSFVSFVSGDEKGQKILRLGDTMYVSYPETDKPIKIQGAALRDSVAGSDLSYEDMAGDQSFASRYSAAIVGRENVDGNECAVLELKAKKSGLAYPELKVWIDLKDFSGRKIQKFSLNGRLLKTEEVTATRRIAGKNYPVRIVVVDELKGGSQTVFDLSKVDLDVSIPTSRFSLEELTF